MRQQTDTRTGSEKAFELVRQASKGQAGAICPGCQQRIVARWAPKQIAEHIAHCEAFRALVQA